MRRILFLFLITTTAVSACSGDTSDTPTATTEEEMTTEETVTESTTMANVISVTTSGAENSYTFSVGISSPDTGCEQYADWWEVITEEGTLLYRRILAHSHVTEQPFVRSGGTVPTASDQVVIIRAHMNTSGYGVHAYKGTVSTGFIAVTLGDDFAQQLATVDPLPSGCAF